MLDSRFVVIAPNLSRQQIFAAEKEAGAQHPVLDIQDSAPAFCLDDSSCQSFCFACVPCYNIQV